MEPLSLGLGLAAHLGGALFHAAVHVAGHETFHHLKHKLSSHWLRNHDVSRTLNEAYIAALGILERDFAKGQPDPAARDHAKAAFARLRAKGAELFPVLQGEAALTELQAAEMLKDTGVAASLVAGLVATAAPCPPGVVRLLEESFADAFSFAFRELGLKGNEKVRAVVTHELLADLRETAGLSAEKLGEVERNLGQLTTLLDGQAESRRFQERFRASIEEGLGRISTQVAEVAAKQDEIIALVRKAVEPGAVRAYAVISDKDGAALGRHALSSPVVTIGREKDNAIQLADKAVSSRHAELKFEEGFIYLRDAGSMNGTFVGDDPKRVRTKVVAFGQKIRIGPFCIELQSPDAGGLPYVPPGTIPVE